MRMGSKQATRLRSLCRYLCRFDYMKFIASSACRALVWGERVKSEERDRYERIVFPIASILIRRTQRRLERRTESS